ncbi:MAG: acyl-CoA synthetase, partial [Candidatus Rokuibacteriota bacterium]
VVDGQIVADPKTLVRVPADGKTIGEVLLRGNTVMLGYLKEPETTEAAFYGGWFHTGDLAVEHPDGYMEIKDRAKDIIISGGENISSIEVEIVLNRHPAVQMAAVVVQLRPGAEASAEEIIAYCRDNLPHFAAPRTVIFGPLPTTATGKIQKYALREQARAL